MGSYTLYSFVSGFFWASLVAQTVKNLPAMQETRVWSLSQEEPLEKGMANPLQYSCLENSVNRGAWRAIVRRVAKSQTRLNSNFLFFCTALICEFIYIVSVAAHFYYCVIHVSSYEHTTDSLFCCQTIYIIFNSLLLQTVPL